MYLHLIAGQHAAPSTNVFSRFTMLFCVVAALVLPLSLNYARKLAEKLAFQCFSVPRGD